MAKWADYCISAVRYDAEHSHIVKVRVHAYSDTGIGGYSEWTRSDVVNAIQRGSTFVTITLSQDKRTWHKGEDVHIVTVNGVKYLRTDANSRAADNLGNLPEF